MKPESWPVAEETHWKTWKFKEIITEAMEKENLDFRKQLAGCQEKAQQQDRLHDAVKSELATLTSYNATLTKALDAAQLSLKKAERETAHMRKMLRGVIRQNDSFKRKLQEGPRSFREDMSGILFQSEMSN